jgi:hypothetical protein
MTVLALEPHSDHVLVVMVQLDGADPTIRLYDTYDLGSAGRPAGLAAIRTRIHELVSSKRPELVVVKDSEALTPATKKYVAASWFRTAEVRGVVLEAAHTAGARTEARGAAAVSRTIGARRGKEYVADDRYWAEQVRGTLTNKKYRPAALMAISALKQSGVSLETSESEP